MEVAQFAVPALSETPEHTGDPLAVKFTVPLGAGPPPAVGATAAVIVTGSPVATPATGSAVSCVVVFVLPTVIDRSAVPTRGVGVEESVTCTVKPNGPTACGVPEMVPSSLRCNPSGSTPALIDQW